MDHNNDALLIWKSNFWLINMYGANASVVNTKYDEYYFPIAEQQYKDIREQRGTG